MRKKSLSFSDALFEDTPPPQSSPTVQPASLRVSAFIASIKETIESAHHPCWISGEISTLTKAPSGHIYFSLKDESASVRAVMWRYKAHLFQSLLKSGAQIEILAMPSMYEPRGEFQVIVEAVRQTGLGSLYERFIRLKERLTAEGLFNADRKRPIPDWPAAIGIITSLQAAALRDVVVTIERRNPSIPLIIYPTAVQGAAAPAQIAAMIHTANQRRECDLLIVCRGGGSFEDLNAYNEEIVVRAAAESAIPIISGVGHETDTTLIDFAADYRAPTPTAAAERASPLLTDRTNQLNRALKRLQTMMHSRLQTCEQCLDRLQLRLFSPSERLDLQQQSLLQLAYRLSQAVQSRYTSDAHRFQQYGYRLHALKPDTILSDNRLAHLTIRMKNAIEAHERRTHTRLKSLNAMLEAISPERILERGYSITYNQEGKIVQDIRTLRTGDTLITQVANGQLISTITDSADHRLSDTLSSAP